MPTNKGNTKKANGNANMKKMMAKSSSKSGPRSGITPKVNLGKQKSSVKWGNDRCSVSGEDFIHTLQLNELPNSRNFAGAVLFPQYVNPWRLPGTRLTQFANLFQRFKFTRFTVKYIPAVPATVAGQIIMCTDTDATWAPVGDTQDVIRMMMAHKDRIMFHVFDNAKAVIPGTSKPEYMCDAQGQDVRVNNQGVFWAALVSPVVKQDGAEWTGAVGSFVLEWEVTFTAARILTPQRITSQSTAKAQWTGDDDYGASLAQVTGAEPNTQTCVAIFRDVGQAIGMASGTPYFLGSRPLSTRVVPSEYERAYNVYGTLRGAQQLDKLDLIPVEGVLTAVDFIWWPIGPEHGTRNSTIDAKVQMSGLSNTTDTGLLNVDYNNTDPRRQADEYFVRATGALPEDNADDPSNLNGVALIYTDENDVTHTVEQNQMLIYRKTTPRALATAMGWTDVQFQNIYGFSVNEKAFVGVLITALGHFVRAVSILAKAARIALAIIREVKEYESEFFKRVNFSAPSELDRANGLHSGHTLSLVKNPPRQIPSGGFRREKASNV